MVPLVGADHADARPYLLHHGPQSATGVRHPVPGAHEVPGAGGREGGVPE